MVDGCTEADVLLFQFVRLTVPRYSPNLDA